MGVEYEERSVRSNHPRRDLVRVAEELRLALVMVGARDLGSESRVDRRAVLSRVEDILDGSPGSEVDLVVVGGAVPRANLLGLLTKGGLGVAVCGSTFRVWRPRGAPALRGSRATRGVGYARARRRGPR